jgi:hypothetical protein
MKYFCYLWVGRFELAQRVMLQLQVLLQTNSMVIYDPIDRVQDERQCTLLFQPQQQFQTLCTDLLTMYLELLKI